MALVLADRVRDTTTTTGTGTVTLSGTAPTGYQNFSVVGNGNTTYYTINAASQWEVGIGTYSSTGPTLARTTVLASSNGGALVNFSAGTKDVFLTYPAEKSVNYDAANNVGIGTAAPGTKLDVIGTVRSTSFSATGTTAYQPQTTMTNWAADATGGYYIFYKGRAGGTTSQSGDTLGTLLWYGYDSSNAAVATSSVYTIQTGAASAGTVPTALVFANVGNVEVMRINSSGNLGLGTSSPVAKLDVSGSSRNRLDLSTASPTWITTNTAANAYATIVHDALAHRWLLSSSDAMVLNSSGNLGLGTSSPSQKLTLQGAQLIIPAAGWSSGQTTYLYFGDTNNGISATNGGYSTYFNFNGHSWTVNGTEAMRIDGARNVGIGTSSPSAPLDVNGQVISGSITVRGDGSEGGQINLNNAANSAATYFFDVDGSGHGRIFTVTNNTNLTLGQLGGTGGYVAFNTSGTERMRIDNGGNVNIGGQGATAAGAIRYFDVYNTENTNGASGTDIRLITQNAAGSGLTTLDLIKYKSGAFYIANAETGSGGIIGFSTSSTERMRITAAGLVGIGTSTPSFLLHGVQNGNAEFRVSATNVGTNSAGVTVENEGNRNWNLWANRSTDNFIIGANSRANDFIVINGSSANVGIGTSAPAVRLDIRGGDLQVSRGASGVAADAAINFGNGTTNYIFGGNANNIMAFATNGSERMRITSGGDIGVGTSAPLTRLFVETPVNIGAPFAFSGNANGVYPPSVFGGSFGYNFTAGGAEVDFWNGWTGAAGTQGGFAFRRQTGASSQNLLMLIRGDGNVGIGTSAPTSKLHVKNSSDAIEVYPSGTWAGQIYNAADASGFNGLVVGNRWAGTGSTVFEVGSIFGGGTGSWRSYYRVDGTGQSIWSNTGVERMRLDTSGNLGVGTSSPTERIDSGSGNIRGQAFVISGDQHLLYSGSSTEIAFRIGASGPYYGIGTTGSSNMRLNSASGGDMLFAIAATEYMRISNTTGNVRIGSGATNVSALSISRSSATATVAASSSIVLSNRNTSINGTIAGGIFVDTYRDVRDPHYSGGIWFTRNQEVSNLSSSSAIVFGTMISWDSGLPTERMRLDSAGNLSIGNTSGNARLRVSGAANVNAPVLGNVGNYPIFISNPDVGYGLGIGTNASDGHVWLQAQRSDSAVAYNLTLNEAGGNVGIGTSSPNGRLTVVGGSVTQYKASGDNNAFLGSTSDTSNNYLRLQNSVNTVDLTCSNGSAYLNSAQGVLWFGTNGVERMRLSGSELLVGTSVGGRAVCMYASDMWLRLSNASRQWLIGPSVGSNFNIWDETGGYNAFQVDTNANINARNSMFLGAGVNLDNKIEVGSGRTGNNYAYIDLIGDTTYTDFGLRLLRGNGGANTFSQLFHRGTGDFAIGNIDAAALTFRTSDSERFRVEATGAVSFSANSLIVGRNSASTDVNTANDTGSISIRGSTTTVAVMSFHRAGAYAINMGLGTDNVFRIGGWSASSNCFQMDGSGNLTMLGNVTAYSDARLKKDVETISGALDLVSKMRGVRYTRTDTDKRGVGVIAQEMLEVLPEVVQQGIGDDDTLSVAYGNLVGVLIEAVKELTARVAELEGK